MFGVVNLIFCALVKLVYRFHLLTLFSRRIARDGRALIFDNAFSGLYPELFHIIDPDAFPVRIILFVRRDPRDQFAELLEFSRGTFPFMANQFIRRYRAQQDRTQQFIEEYSRDKRAIVRLIDFESFVFDDNSCRTTLKKEIETLLSANGISGTWSPKKFIPEDSQQNTGVWSRSRYSREIGCIAQSLPDFLHPRATAREQ